MILPHKLNQAKITIFWKNFFLHSLSKASSLKLHCFFKFFPTIQTYNICVVVHEDQYFEKCFHFGMLLWLAETLIKIFGCQSQRNGLALWRAIIREKLWKNAASYLYLKCTGQSQSNVDVCIHKNALLKGRRREAGRQNFVYFRYL